MKSKVAIVEDDKFIRDMYSLKFKTAGYDVYTAENGKEGLALLEKIKPKLVLLDIMMPEMTGDEMLKTIRQTEWGKKIKVLILTNVSKDEEYSKVEGLDVSGYIVKAHYTPKEVVDIVKNVLK